MDLERRVLNYFEAFQDKRLDLLEEMFADEIKLKDWSGNLVGIKDVLEFNKQTFKKIETIKINPQKIYRDSSSVIVKLVIDINNGQEILFVMDIIKYNPIGKIISIEAYKR